jgi:hypothetical protein
MSVRALGRQFAAQLANRNKPWVPGTPDRPQGQLFHPHQLPLRGIFDPDVKESARRRTAGEANPDAPWRPPFLQYHFQKHPIPEQQELFRR